MPTYPADCRADLHAHSTASDGHYSPEILVQQAALAGVELFSLTDHDSLAGLDAAAAAADAAGMAFVPGVEISVSWENKTLHILGLNITRGCPALRQGLEGIQQQRVERAQSIGAKLENLGLSRAYERADDMADGGQITRSHFARLLVQDGLSPDLKQAFRRYLGTGKSAYVKTRWARLDEALSWIHAARGLAVLAHPLRYQLSGSWRRRMLQAFKQAGGDALEVSSGSSQQSEALAICTRDALEFDLLASSGSDFHGPEQRWLQLGRLAPLSTRLTPVWTCFER